MKKQLLILLFSSFTFLTSAQDQLLNASFENWSTNPSLLTDSPNDWVGASVICTGINPAVCKSTTIKTTDAYQGTYAARLENINNNTVGQLNYMTPIQEFYSFSYKPTALTGYYKFNNAGSDNITISVVLYGTSNSDIVGGGTLFFNTSQNVYTKFTVPITYLSTTQPQNIYVGIRFSEFSSLSSTFTVDDLLFTYGTTTATQSATPVYAGVQFYPNPGKDVIHFEKPVTNISISTTNGSHVLAQSLESTSLNIDGLEKGIYIISYEYEGLLIHGKLIVEN
jgi:hypothetical protein